MATKALTPPRNRFAYWLGQHKLIAGCALVALLALALARPSMQATGAIGNEEAPVAAALVFDTAPHMLYRHQDRTRLQEATRKG